MSVTIKKVTILKGDAPVEGTPVETTKLLKALQISPELVNLVVSKGVTFVIMSSATLIMKGGQTVAEVKMAKAALDLALKGELGDFSLGHLTGMMTQALEKALVTGSTSYNKPEFFKPPKEDLPPTPKKPPVYGATPLHTNAGPMTQEYPEDKMATGPVQKLSEANVMYQPVVGTSAGSRYFFIGATKDLKIAARIKGKSLSVRVEGNVEAFSDLLKENGFSFPETHHASIHVEIQTVLMANRVVGALLVGLGEDVLTPLPKMKKIVGKGA